MASAKSDRGMRGWFRRCVARVQRDASVVDPSAVCGAALRDKRKAGYVPERERERAGRARSNRSRRETRRKGRS